MINEQQIRWELLTLGFSDHECKEELKVAAFKVLKGIAIVRLSKQQINLNER